MDTKIIKIENPDNLNFILGQSHFIKTVEDIHEVLITSVPSIKFGLAFAEASGDCLIRTTGNDPKLIELAQKNMLALSTGHAFILFMQEAYPINILNRLKEVPEIVHFYCATANPVEVIVAETQQGRGIMGVIDGLKSKGIENENDKKERQAFLRKIGYKF